MSDVLDLARLAARLDLSYDTVQGGWRAWVLDEGFPPPFLGAGRGQRPRWLAPAIDAWLARRSGLAGASACLTPSDAAQRDTLAHPANDPLPTGPKGRAAKLLAAAGGG